MTAQEKFIVKINFGSYLFYPTTLQTELAALFELEFSAQLCTIPIIPLARASQNGFVLWNHYSDLDKDDIINAFLSSLATNCPCSVLCLIHPFPDFDGTLSFTSVRSLLPHYFPNTPSGTSRYKHANHNPYPSLAPQSVCVCMGVCVKTIF